MATGARATLSEGRWTPDIPITFDETEAHGPPVTTGLDAEPCQPISNDFQLLKRQPTVEYRWLPKVKGPKDMGSGKREGRRVDEAIHKAFGGGILFHAAVPDVPVI